MVNFPDSIDKLFVNTNIFGIAVDSDEDIEESVWNKLDEVSNGEYKFFTSEIVLAEIEDNPHKPTREKEKELVEATVDEVVE